MNSSANIEMASCWPVCPNENTTAYHDIVGYLIYCGIDIAFGPNDTLPTQLPKKIESCQCILIMSHDLERHLNQLTEFHGFNTEIKTSRDSQVFKQTSCHINKIFLHKNKLTWLVILDCKLAEGPLLTNRIENPLITGTKLRVNDSRMSQRMLKRSDVSIHKKLIEGLMSYERTDWGDIPLGVCKAILEAFSITRDTKLLEKAISICDKLLKHEPSRWSVHNVTPFYAFSKLYNITGDKRLLNIMHKHLYAAFNSEAFRKYSIHKSYSFFQSDGFMTGHTRDHLEHNTCGAGMYADLVMTNYMPLMAAGHTLGRANEFADKIFPCLLELKKHILDKKTGLYHQSKMGISNKFPGITGHGSHWVLFGLVHILEDAPKDHPLFPKILRQFQQGCQAICQYQDSDGSWHHIATMPFTPFSRIYTPSLSHTILRGVRLGFLDHSFLENGIKGWMATKRHHFRYTTLGQGGGTPCSKRFEFYLMQNLLTGYSSTPNCKVFWTAHALHEILQCHKFNLKNIQHLNYN